MTEFSFHERLAALEVVVVGHWEVRRKGGDSLMVRFVPVLTVEKMLWWGW